MSASINRDLASYIKEINYNIRIVDGFGLKYTSDTPNGLQMYEPTMPHGIQISAYVPTSATSNGMSISKNPDGSRRIEMKRIYPLSAVSDPGPSTFELMTSGIFKEALNARNLKDNTLLIKGNTPLTVGQIVKFDGTNYVPTSASNVDADIPLGIIKSIVATSGDYELLQFGFIDNLIGLKDIDDRALVAGTTYYQASGSNELGKFTKNKPNGSRIIFMATGPDQGYYIPIVATTNVNSSTGSIRFTDIIGNIILPNQTLAVSDSAWHNLYTASANEHGTIEIYATDTSQYALLMSFKYVKTNTGVSVTVPIFAGDTTYIALNVQSAGNKIQIQNNISYAPRAVTISARVSSFVS